MFYKFPVIKHIDQVLEAIKGRSEFIVARNEEHGYTIINYNVAFEDTFPSVVDERTAILRECRGITFDNATGRVINRKFHKFFNVFEREETRIENIDFSVDHQALMKLDGSMISPLLIGNKIRWATKMGLTDIAKQVDTFVEDKPNYDRFAEHMWDIRMTPIFEWCSRFNRVVIDYPVSTLALLAVRDNETGEYMSYSDLITLDAEYNLNLVPQVSGTIDDISAFIERTARLENEEGYIISFANGMRYKVKAEQYLQLHKTLDGLRFEKDAIRLILTEKLDDAKAFLPADIGELSDRFAKDLYGNIRKIADDIHWQVIEQWDNTNGSRKKFAEYATRSQYAQVLFKVWDMQESDTNSVDAIEKLIINLIITNTGSQSNVDKVRKFFGNINWYAYQQGKIAIDD